VIGIGCRRSRGGHSAVGPAPVAWQDRDRQTDRETDRRGVVMDSRVASSRRGLVSDWPSCLTAVTNPGLATDVHYSACFICLPTVRPSVGPSVCPFSSSYVLTHLARLTHWLYPPRQHNKSLVCLPVLLLEKTSAVHDAAYPSPD